MSDKSNVFRVALYGFMLGFFIHGVGFSDYAQLHQMFTFADLRMFLTFAGAAVIIMVGLRMMTRGYMLPPKSVHRGVVPGSVLFGLGWVLTGACPGVVLVQLGEGYLPALASLAGMFVGIGIYNALSGRLFRWDTGSCET